MNLRFLHKGFSITAKKINHNSIEAVIEGGAIYDTMELSFQEYDDCKCSELLKYYVETFLVK